MSPHQPSRLPDQQSETSARRGRPPVPRARVLAAAGELFAAADTPHAISMDTIAAAAGVGKGTLFRAFGNRDGLLDALWNAKLTALREAVEHGEPPLGPATPSCERILAFLDAVLTVKLENRHLISARETASAGIRQSDHYRWMHALLRELIEDAVPTVPDAGYTAHALLSAMYMDLIEELLASGRSAQDIRAAQSAYVKAVVDDVRPH